MRALIQRVSQAEVVVDGKSVGSIGPGLCVFVGVTHSDDMTAAQRLARRLWVLRVFKDEASLTNRSAQDLGLALLVISQFTLYADVSGGRRPSFVQAAPPEHAEPLVAEVVRQLLELGADVATGQFRAEMEVRLVNDGPFTLMVDV